MPIHPFKYEVGLGYQIELLLGLIPLGFCEAVNNLELPEGGHLTLIQKLAMDIKFPLILLVFIELSFLAWEVYLIKQLKKAGYREFQTTPEFQRRKRFGKKMAKIGLASILAIGVATLILCLVGEKRHCAPQHSLENAVCMPCESPFCEDCTQGHHTCLKCMEGYT
jgi:hypothetical protein